MKSLANKMFINATTVSVCLPLKCIKITNFNLLICAPVTNGDFNSKLLHFILKLLNTLTVEYLDLFHKCISNIMLDRMLDTENRSRYKKNLRKSTKYVRAFFYSCTCRRAEHGRSRRRLQYIVQVLKRF